MKKCAHQCSPPHMGPGWVSYCQLEKGHRGPHSNGSFSWMDYRAIVSAPAPRPSGLKLCIDCAKCIDPTEYTPSCRGVFLDVVKGTNGYYTTFSSQSESWSNLCWRIREKYCGISNPLYWEPRKG